jgi:hypothetical protein
MSNLPPSISRERPGSRRAPVEGADPSVPSRSIRTGTTDRRFGPDPLDPLRSGSDPWTSTPVGWGDAGPAAAPRAAHAPRSARRAPIGPAGAGGRARVAVALGPPGGPRRPLGHPFCRAWGSSPSRVSSRSQARRCSSQSCRSSPLRAERLHRRRGRPREREGGRPGRVPPLSSDGVRTARGRELGGTAGYSTPTTRVRTTDERSQERSGARGRSRCARKCGEPRPRCRSVREGLAPISPPPRTGGDGRGL